VNTTEIQRAYDAQPSVADRVLVLLILILLGLLALRQIGSPDAGFHLATGHSMLSGEGWPRTDTFTYTVRDHPYVDTSWGYDVLVALIESVFGVTGLMLLHAGFVVATFAIVYRTARLAPADPRSLVVVFLLGGLLSEERFEVRPELVTYLLLALALYILQRYAEKADRRLWPLLPLFLLWSNMHALFVTGWVVLGCFILGTWIRDHTPDRRLIAWSLACMATGLLNPYGWRGLRMSLVLATRLGSNVFHQHIAEYESPIRTIAEGDIGFYLLPIACLFLFLVLAVAAIPRLWYSRRPSAVLLVLVFVPLALSMVRNAPLFAVACLPGTVWALPLGRLLEGARMHARGRRFAVVAVRSGVAVVVVLLGIRAYTDAYYVVPGRLERFGRSWNRYRLPVDAAAWVRKQTWLEGRMLNDFDYGGHLIWVLKQPVFIDGRLEVMGEEFFEYCESVFTSADALEECVARYDIGWTIFPYRRRPELLQRVSGDPRWRLAYADHDAVVFVRASRDKAQNGLGSVVPARDAVRPRMELERLPGLGGPERPSSLRRWLDGLVRKQTYPVESYSMGVFDYLRGDWAGLATWSAEAIRQSNGAYPEHYGNLGSALYALGDLENARRCLEIAVSETPWYRRGSRRQLRSVLAEVEQESRGSR
jgi:hypothetical protein